MDASDAPSQFLAILQIILVDILLSADNAVVIALACRSLRPEDRRRGYVAAMLAAVAMRLLFASGIVFVLQVPFLKLLGAAALVVISIRLVAEGPQAAPGDPSAASTGAALWRVVAAILIGDAAMSLDNVLAVAALANGSVALLAAGLAISIPLLVYGSVVLNSLIDRTPALVFLAGAMLGWVAGSIAVSDPAIASWVAQQAPALTVTLPAGAAALVLWQALILRPRSATVLPKP